MQVKLLRKDGKGIKGTYDNANHHAIKCLPFVKALEAAVHTFGFAEWIQGHNVHLFKTHDGRSFDLIPYCDDTGYIGIELRRRESRSKAIPIMAITNISEVPLLVIVIQALARPHPVNKNTQFRYDNN